ncbi:MAG TPA: morphogenetic protein [Buttiauxella sp.]|jgi:hypothetical protein
MFVPDFFLPSNPAKKIVFSTPTVKTGIKYCEINPDFEERTTTQYLNELQSGPTISDSAEWTAQDRRTALWWIFIGSRSVTTTTFSYQCQHCSNEHYFDMDFIDLDATNRVLSREPFIDFELKTCGEMMKWRVVPLNGHAMERLEAMRANLPGKDDPLYSEYVAELRLWELVYQTRLFYDLDTDFDAAAERRFKQIQGMDMDQEFLALAARVVQAQDVLRHGLNMKIDKGQALLYTPFHNCPELMAKESKVAQTQLLIGFRNKFFIENVRFNWLANLSDQPDGLRPAAG